MLIFIAISAGVFGLMMAAIANGASPPHSLIGYGVAAWCFAISGFCLAKGRLRNLFGSVVATGVVIGCLVNLVRTVDAVSTTSLISSGIDLATALLLLMCFGWPSLKFIRNTRFGYVLPPPPLEKQIAVEFDDAEFRILRHDEAPAPIERFEWQDVTRVCFIDAALYRSDVLLIEIRSREKPVVIPTEAAGGSEFFGKLCDSGLFPEEVSLKAIRETSGRVHCWPPHEGEATR